MIDDDVIIQVNVCQFISEKVQEERENDGRLTKSTISSEQIELLT